MRGVSTKPPLRRGHRPRPTVRGAVAGAIVVVGAAVVAWWILGGRSAPVAEVGDGTVRRIKEVKPAAAPTNRMETVENSKERPPQKVGEIRDGKILLANGKLYEYKNVHTNRTAALRPKYKIFRHPSENVIASVLCVQPGETLVGGLPHFHGRLTADFLESLKEPILPEQGDSEEAKELKQLVKQAKIELKAAYDRGEDIEEILANERKESQRLAQYKQEIAKMAFTELKDCKTEADFDTLLEAANKILEEKGIAPLKSTPFTRLRMKKFAQEENE